MDKFEEYKMKKIRPIIRNWFDWFIKQSVMGKEQKKKNRDKVEDKIFNDIWRLFDTEKEEKKKNIIRNVRILFKQ